MDVKVHYKMRKRKKQWIVIGISVMSGVVISTQSIPQKAHAAETTAVSTQLESSSTQTASTMGDSTNQTNVANNNENKSANDTNKVQSDTTSTEANTTVASEEPVASVVPAASTVDAATSPSQDTPVKDSTTVTSENKSGNDTTKIQADTASTEANTVAVSADPVTPTNSAASATDTSANTAQSENQPVKDNSASSANAVEQTPAQKAPVATETTPAETASETKAAETAQPEVQGQPAAQSTTTETNSSEQNVQTPATSETTTEHQSTENETVTTQPATDQTTIAKPAEQSSVSNQTDATVDNNQVSQEADQTAVTKESPVVEQTKPAEASQTSVSTDDQTKSTAEPATNLVTKPASPIENKTDSKISTTTAQPQTDTTAKVATESPVTDQAIKPVQTPAKTAPVQPVVSKAVMNSFITLANTAAIQKDTITINGTNSFTGTYDADSNPKEGTPSSNKVTVTFAGINSNDVLKITVPNFFKLSDGPIVNGFTKSLSSDGKSITYTATGSSSGSFDLNAVMQVLQITTKTLTGNITLSLNNNVIQSIPTTANYKLYDQSTTLFPTNNSSANNGKVKVGENFVSRVDGGSGNFSSTYLNAGTYEGITYTIPVPKGYELDSDATQKFNKLAMQADNSYYKISQAGIGSDVIITVDPSVFSTNKNAYNILGNPVYFVGKLTTNDTTAATASTATFKNKINDLTKQISSPFSINLVTGDPVDGIGWASSNVVYVGSNDLGALNVSPNGYVSIYSWDNQTANPSTFTMAIPENTLAKGLKLSDNTNGLQQLLANGLTGTVNALDKDGKVIATTDLKQLAGSSFGQVTWQPDPGLDSQISKFEIKLGTMPGQSFGSLQVVPILAATALPHGTKTVSIPVKFVDDVNGNAAAADTFSYTVTDLHTIYGQGEVNAITYPVSPGSIIGHNNDYTTTLNSYLYYLNGTNGYQIFDNDAYLYLQLPSNTTFVSNGNQFNNYAGTIHDSTTGLNYVKFRIPAGTKFGDASWNLSTLKVSDDLTPDMQVKLDATKAPYILVMQNQQIDSTSWLSKGTSAKIYTTTDLTNQYAGIANDVNTMGLKTLSVYSPFLIDRQWPTTIPNVFFVSNGIKNNNDQSYTSGNTPADFSATKGQSGTIRLYGYNGTSAQLTNFNDLLSLPKKANGSDFSLNLTGPVTDVPVGTTILYSTQAVNLADGAKLTSADLAKFTTADKITDWSTVQSVLFQAPTLDSHKSIQALVPVVVADVSSTAGNKVATANSVSYTDTAASSNTPLEARVAVPANVTVNYLDKAGNSILTSDSKSGALGDTVTLTAPTINGYNLTSNSTVNYQYTDGTDQHVDFTYDLAQMSATVNLIDSITGANLGTRTISGNYTTKVPLTDTFYTTVQGYTANPSNVQSYTFTNSAVQTVNLYFNPVVQNVKVYYKNQSGKEIAPSTQQTGYKGNSVQVEAVPVVGYTPENNKAIYTFNTGTNQSYTFTYDGETKDFTVSYQLADGKTAPTTKTFQAKVGDTFDQTSAKIAISGYNFANVVQGVLNGTISVDANDQVIVTDANGKQLTGANATNIVLQYKPVATASMSSGQKVYDGQAITAIPTITLADGMTTPTLSLSDFLANGGTLTNAKDVATYQIGLSDTGKQKIIDANGTVYDFTNFDWSKVAGTYTITPAQAVINAPTVTKVYDGKNYTETVTPTFTGVLAGDALNYTVTGLENAKDVGTYAINVTAGTNKNYTVTVNPGTLTITPAKATIKGPKVMKTYDGQAYTGELKPEISGVMNGENLAYTLTDLSNDKDAGTYTISVTNGANKNYDVTIEDGSLTINKANATIAAPTVEKMYDGKAYTGDLTPKFTGVVEGENLAYTLNDLSKDKDAGKYSILVTLMENKNYSVSTMNGTLTINKANATITAPTVEKTYDGKAYTGDLTPKFTGVVAGENLAYTLTDLSQDKDAGTYAIKATPTTNKNYNVSVVDGNLTIDKAKATITAPTNLTKVYDGTGYTTPVTPTFTGVVDGEKLAYTIDDLSQDKEVGTYTVGVKAGDNKNYDVTVNNGQLVVTKSQAVIKGPIVSKTYDGQAYTGALQPTITGLANGDNLDYSLESVSQDKDAGTYVIKVNLKDSKNYDVSVVDGTLTINKAKATITAPTDLTKVYDGKGYITPVTPAITGVATGDTLNYTIDDLSNDKNVGTYTVGVKAGDNKNYDVAVNAGQLVVTKANAVVSAPTLEKTYDGKGYIAPVTPTIAGVVAGDTLNYTIDDLSQDKDAGTYTIKATSNNNKNYDVSVVDGTLTIDKAQATVSAPTLEKTYDGKGYTDLVTPTITGVVANDTLNYTIDDLSQDKNAGTYAVGVTAGDNKNYDVTVKAGSLLINKAKANVTAPTIEKTYDGKAYAGDLTPTITGVVAGDTLNYDLTDISQDKDAGTYTITATPTDNQNYDVTTTDGALTINKADAVIKAPTLSKVYDGKGYTGVITPEVSGVAEGDTLSYSIPDANEDKAVGTYAINVKAGDNQNYNVTIENGTLNVTKAPVTIKAPNLNKVYDGKGYTEPVTLEISGVVAGENLAYSLTDLSNAKDAGTYAIDVTAGDNQNYDVTVENGQLTITKAPAVLTFDSFEHTEDGKQVAVKYGVDNPLLAQLLEKMGVKYVGPGVGTYTLDGKEFDLTDLAKNFNIKVVPGMIKIVAAKDPGGKGDVTPPSKPGTNGGGNTNVTPNKPGTNGGGNTNVTPNKPGTNGGGSNTNVTPNNPGTNGGGNTNVTPNKPGMNGGGNTTIVTPNEPGKGSPVVTATTTTGQPVMAQMNQTTQMVDQPATTAEGKVADQATTTSQASGDKIISADQMMTDLGQTVSDSKVAAVQPAVNEVTADQGTQTNAKTYPKTGEKESRVGLLGVLFVGMAGLVGIFRKKKEND